MADSCVLHQVGACSNQLPADTVLLHLAADGSLEMRRLVERIEACITKTDAGHALCTRVDDRQTVAPLRVGSVPNHCLFGLKSLS